MDDTTRQRSTEQDEASEEDEQRDDDSSRTEEEQAAQASAQLQQMQQASIARLNSDDVTIQDVLTVARNTQLIGGEVSPELAQALERGAQVAAQNYENDLAQKLETETDPKELTATIIGFERERQLLGLGEGSGLSPRLEQAIGKAGERITEWEDGLRAQGLEVDGGLAKTLADLVGSGTTTGTGGGIGDALGIIVAQTTGSGTGDGTGDDTSDGTGGSGSDSTRDTGEGPSRFNSGDLDLQREPAANQGATEGTGNDPTTPAPGPSGDPSAAGTSSSGAATLPGTSGSGTGAGPGTTSHDGSSGSGSGTWKSGDVSGDESGMSVSWQGQVGRDASGSTYNISWQWSDGSTYRDYGEGDSRNGYYDPNGNKTTAPSSDEQSSTDSSTNPGSGSTDDDSGSSDDETDEDDDEEDDDEEDDDEEDEDEDSGTARPTEEDSGVPIRDPFGLGAREEADAIERELALQDSAKQPSTNPDDATVGGTPQFNVMRDDLVTDPVQYEETGSLTLTTAVRLGSSPVVNPTDPAVADDYGTPTADSIKPRGGGLMHEGAEQGMTSDDGASADVDIVLGDLGGAEKSAPAAEQVPTENVALGAEQQVDALEGGRDEAPAVRVDAEFLAQEDQLSSGAPDMGDHEHALDMDDGAGSGDVPDLPRGDG